MKERGILFKGEMVRASKDRRKTQTRRIVKVPIIDRNGTSCELGASELSESDIAQYCPYGKPEDRLWVREAWKTCATYDPYSPAQIDSGAAVLWLADGAKKLNGPEEWGRYRHARFMPRWASRITLEITGVRVERLQDISAEDCLSEGINLSEIKGVGSDAAQIDAYKHLWESINGKGAWDKNPFVWVVEFRKLG